VNIGQSNCGQLLPQSDHLKARRHNAKRCRLATRQAIIYALATGESVECTRRTFHVSRHTVLAVRNQYAQEIEAAQEEVKERIAMAYVKKSLDALNVISQRIAAEHSPLKQFKLYDALTERMQALETPVQTNPYPLSIKLAALRHAKRNQLSFSSTPSHANSG
jgi:hypothetical protein